MILLEFTFTFTSNESSSLSEQNYFPYPKVSNISKNMHLYFHGILFLSINRRTSSINLRNKKKKRPCNKYLLISPLIISIDIDRASVCSNMIPRGRIAWSWRNFASTCVHRGEKEKKKVAKRAKWKREIEREREREYRYRFSTRVENRPRVPPRI